MKVYLVGGAVRDKLLNLPIHERDWVVVGATPDDLLAQNYKQVGKDFPVFLHPNTKEEYALARKERKSGSGYYGFVCDFSPEVSLEEDLARRDLTINAMALDNEGKLVDPYHGLDDLNKKQLRHVSPAFVEDPVRVLRVARFAARFHHLGFTVAQQTRQLIYAMVCNNELAYLVPERVWQEWQKSLAEQNPECFIAVLRASGALKVIIPELDNLFGVPNPPQYHLEIDSGIHTLYVLQAACTLTNDPVTRFAALMHDLGKAATPMHNWPKHHGHEERGVDIIEQLCQRLKIPNEYRILAVLVSRFHLLIHRLNELRPATVVNVLEQTDAFRRPARFIQLLICSKADAMGCGKIVQYKQFEQWQHILQECSKISAKYFVDKGLEGAAIKEGLHQQRVACVKQIVNEWNLHEK